jgi:hypothetical protein
MPESFIPVWMSVGEAEKFQETLAELAGSEAGFPEREWGLITGALDNERRRSYAEMDAEQKAASFSSPQAEAPDAVRIRASSWNSEGELTGLVVETDEEAVELLPEIVVIGLREELAAAKQHSPQAEVQDCETCKGSGTDLYQGPGEWLSDVCPDCNGTGKQPPAEPQGDLVENVARAIAEAGDSVFAWEQMPDGVGNHSRKQGELLRARTRADCRTLAHAAIAASRSSLALEVKEEERKRLRDSLPHERTVGHLYSIATLLEGVRSGAGGLPIETKRDVDFLRDLAVVLAGAIIPAPSEPEEGNDG